MKKIVALLLLVLVSAVFAHAQTGIAFQNNLTWAQVKEKAKKENKLIFLDCFTTWCQPCRAMAQDVFTQQKVGDFFNQNFINVAVQFDETKRDSESTKRWHKQVKEFERLYSINSYPTYMFLNADGIPVHFIRTAVPDADEFIARSAMALNPQQQYAGLKNQFKNGNRDTAFLTNLISDALKVNDINGRDSFINAYLATQKNLLTTPNIKYIAQATHSVNDIGFTVLRDYPALVDSVTKKGQDALLLREVVFDDVIIPIINQDGKVLRSSFMVMYEGKTRKYVNWDSVKTMLQAQYPKQANDVLLYSRIQYFRFLNNWDAYTQEVDAHMKNILADDLFTYANYSSLFNTNKNNWAAAARWMEYAIKQINVQQKYYYLKMYGVLLYKSGRTDAATTQMEKYLTLIKNPDEGATEMLEKMKKGEQI